MLRRQAYLIALGTLLMLLVILWVSTMGGSIRTTQAGPVGGNVSGLSPAQQVDPTPPPALEVGLTEYEISMPTSLSAGVHSFDVANNGESEHNLVFDGQGLEIELAEDLDPGQDQNIQVYLRPGTYAVYCPVGDHREQGMEIELTIEPTEEEPEDEPDGTDGVTGSDVTEEPTEEPTDGTDGVTGSDVTEP